MLKLAPVFGLLVALGCGGSSSTANAPGPEAEAAPAEPAPAEPAPAEPAPTEAEPAIPEGSKFVCHLDCSGKTASAYGVTEEEARTNARGFVEETCRPEDGQYFIVCDPLK